MIDLSKVQNIEFDGVDPNEAPDFPSAVISWATYDGYEMTPWQLAELNGNRKFVLERLLEQL